MKWSSGAKRLSAFERPSALSQGKILTHLWSASTCQVEANSEKGKILTQVEANSEIIIRCASEICRRTLISLAVCRWLYGPIWIEISQFYRSQARAIWIKISSILLIASHGNLNAKYCTCNNTQNRLVNVAMAGNMTQRVSTGIHVFLQCCFFCGFPSYSCLLSIPKFRKSYFTLSSTAQFPGFYLLSKQRLGVITNG